MAVALTKKICDILVKKKLVALKDLKRAGEICAEKGGNLSDILVEMGVVSKENLLGTISEEFGFPPIKLSSFSIDPAILSVIPRKITENYKILPISRTEKQLTVAMVDPLNIVALDDLKVLTHLNISPVIASEEEMDEAIEKYYAKSTDEKINMIVDDMKSTGVEMISEDGEDISSGELLKITEEAPIVRLTNMILSSAVKERASDILLEPMYEKSRVRLRIDGMLHVRYEPPKKFHQALVSRFKVMSDLDIAEKRLPQDGRFRVKIENRKVDFRISTIPSSYGEKVALRILDKKQAMIDLDTLGFKEREKNKIKEEGKKPHGMILICGPTGSGKTTTLYSVLKYVDDPGKNIITVEDPVEYEIKGFNQVAVHEEIGLTFAGCLRSILRQDPDIIMVGEIRDLETLDVAIKSALTGHLVLSTLHTNTAAGSVVRMTNMGIEPFLIAASVELIAAQRLLRKLCPDCREIYVPEKKTAKKYNLFDPKGKVKKIYRSVGCKRCLNTGYLGRVGII
ncbi:MAG: Flp pilus assembly complex ATPase component TadA, partial [Candidatus Omnitrophica bacterium]|nr:Flp pilus assembly complex ATPase component TadA [Candidatus Omnitrophota bacterium]